MGAAVGGAGVSAGPWGAGLWGSCSERRQVRQECTRSGGEGRDSAAVGCGQQREGR